MQLPAPLGQSVSVPYPETLAALCPSPIVTNYGPNVVIDLTLGGLSYIVVATNGVAFQINSPLAGVGTPCSGQRINITIKNASGGALGVVTWGTAYKQAGSFAAGNGQRRSAQFEFDGTNWVLIAGPTADIPN